MKIEEKNYSILRVLEKCMIPVLMSLIVIPVLFYFCIGGFDDIFNLNCEKFHYIYYLLFCLILITFVGILGVLNYKKENSLTKLILFIGILVLCYVFVVIFANFESPDYKYHLLDWFSFYKENDLKTSLYYIVDISDYTSIYNYFLMFFAKFGFNSLYSIKALTFVFSLLLAWIVEKIISYIKKSEFNYLRFALILILPAILIEFCAWGQCDAIYTFFAFLAFYFALKKKSKLSFLSIGISFCFKLQFLFIVPILFVMLIVKDEDDKHYLRWKDLWIAPLCYIINLIPVFSGRPFFDVLCFYFKQATHDQRLSGDCFNLCAIYKYFGINKLTDENSLVFKVIAYSHTALTLTILSLILVHIFKVDKRKKLNPTDLIFYGMVMSFVMVFFMPKMLDRFYFISMIFALIYLFVANKNQSNFFAAEIVAMQSFSVCYTLFLFLSRFDLIFVALNMLTFVIMIIMMRKKSKSCFMQKLNVVEGKNE